MQLISDYMNNDHRQCDEVFARAESMAAAGDYAGLERDAGTFLRRIERHIEIEEKLLFPAFEDKTGMTGGPTQVMCMEHEQMRPMFAQMRAAIEAKDAKQYLSTAKALYVLLKQHNMKEENMLYPMLDQALGEDASTLLAELENIAV